MLTLPCRHWPRWSLKVPVMWKCAILAKHKTNAVLGTISWDRLLVFKSFCENVLLGEFESRERLSSIFWFTLASGCSTFCNYSGYENRGRECRCIQVKVARQQYVFQCTHFHDLPNKFTTNSQRKSTNFSIKSCSRDNQHRITWMKTVNHDDKQFYWYKVSSKCYQNS